jgi:hypothetical protein
LDEKPAVVHRWDTTGGRRLDELNVLLRACVMVRRLKRDVLAQLPPKRRQVRPCGLASASSQRGPNGSRLSTPAALFTFKVDHAAVLLLRLTAYVWSVARLGQILFGP